MKDFNEYDAERIYESKYKTRAEEVIKDKEKLEETARKTKEKLEKLGNGGPLDKVLDDVQLMLRLIRAYIDGSYREIPVGSLIAIVGAILYFLSPIDLIPDIIPIIGLMDDVFIIALTLKQVHSDLENFKRWEESRAALSE